MFWNEPPLFPYVHKALAKLLLNTYDCNHFSFQHLILLINGPGMRALSLKDSYSWRQKTQLKITPTRERERESEIMFEAK